jgi:hypothetical protein
MRQGIVAQAVILATQEAEIRRIAVGGQPEQKVYEPLSYGTCLSLPTTLGSTNRRIQVPTAQA